MREVSRSPHRSWTIVAAFAAVAGLLTPAAAATGAAAPAGVAASALKPPKIVGEQCGGATGVTVVVDFRNLHNEAGKVMNKVKIGCAKGPQSDGLTALLDAGFDVDPDSDFLCEIDDRPLPEDSVCASTGYWSYWHAERDGRWKFSNVGPADWVPPAGSLEGWSWSPYDKEWGSPRVKPRDLFRGDVAR